MAEKLECDLVMRGGITSGIVYPRAIAKLAETYNSAGSAAPRPAQLPPLQRQPRLTAPSTAKIISRSTSRGCRRSLGTEIGGQDTAGAPVPTASARRAVCFAC